jgi:hypothetical protein
MRTERRRGRRFLAYAAFLIGVLIVFQGLLGIILPETLMQLVSEFQFPPVIYLAAAIRVAFGLVLCFEAPASRAPVLLGVLGAFIVVGGLLTPFFGMHFAHVILGWWSDGGVAMVRGWAVLALVLGGFVAWASWPVRHEGS